MALFDALIDDMASRFRLGSNAAPLVREGLSLIAAGQGGVGSFLDLFRKAGFAPQVSAWLGQPNAPALATQDLERAIGTSALGGIASRLGLSQSAVTTALAYCVPKLIGLLTPDGLVPTALPAEVTNFLAPPGGQITPSQISSVRPASSEQTTPNSRVSARSSILPGWLWPVLAAVALLLIGWRLWPTLTPKPAESPIAQAPAPAAEATSPAPAPASYEPVPLPGPSLTAPAPSSRSIDCRGIPLRRPRQLRVRSRRPRRLSLPRLRPRKLPLRRRPRRPPPRRRPRALRRLRLLRLPQRRRPPSHPSRRRSRSTTKTASFTTPAPSMTIRPAHPSSRRSRLPLARTSSRARSPSTRTATLLRGSPISAPLSTPSRVRTSKRSSTAARSASAARSPTPIARRSCRRSSPRSAPTSRSARSRTS